MYLAEASLPPRGRGTCATDDRHSETGEVKGLWSDGRLWGRSSAEGGRAVLNIVTGIPEPADADNPEAAHVQAAASGDEAVPKMAERHRS